MGFMLPINGKREKMPMISDGENGGFLREKG